MNGTQGTWKLFAYTLFIVICTVLRELSHTATSITIYVHTIILF